MTATLSKRLPSARHQRQGSQYFGQIVWIDEPKSLGLFLYDHLGGGFARYSVDARWLVPHFEKMLYDNAQLAGLYLTAYLETGTPPNTPLLVL